MDNNARKFFIILVYSRIKNTAKIEITFLCRHLHLELCKISREIDSIFGIQTTFKMGCYFGYMAMNLYELFNIIFIKNYITNSILANIFICIQLTWFFHNILKLLLINYMCEKVCTKVSILLNSITFNKFSHKII